VSADEPVAAWVVRVLGPCDVVADHSWAHGDSQVVRVRAADGTDWFVKRHRYADRYDREVAAYRRWVPVFGDRAPVLRAHDDELRVLLLSAVPGAPGTAEGDRPEIQHQAGRLLRVMHSAQPPEPWPDFAGQRLASFHKWSATADGLLDAKAVDFVRGQVEGLADLPAPAMVPCHLDYQPRNWLVSGDTLYVIDFEWARQHCWTQDLARLYFGSWQSRPDARAAFLDGYGRPVDGDDLAILHALGAASALSSTVWARQHGDTEFEAAARRNLAALMAGTIR
jgi:Ser/Thr protein kinase RdoA (MazF antagonist)